MVQFVTDDCVWTNPRGTLAGAQAIRADYAEHFSVSSRRSHVWSNVIVRLSDDLRSGGAASNFFAVLETDGKPPRLVGGLAADQLVKRDGEWKICVRNVTANFSVNLAGPGDAP
jgi:hypothetical protein